MSEWEKAKSGTFYMLASDPELVEGLPICKGCFNGIYPMEPPTEDIRGDFEK